MATASRGPEYGIVWSVVGKCPVEVGQKYQRLRLNAVLSQPREAWTEVCASATDRVEMNLFPGLIGLHFVYLGIEVQDMNALWPLAFEDRADLSLKETQ
jgi:hypothetical protein